MEIELDPKIWGKHAWIYLHSCTLGYSDKPTFEEKTDMKNMLIGLRSTLPCDHCRQNYRDKHLTKLTEDILSSKQKLIFWLIDVHNAVNRDHGKKEYSYEEALQYFHDLYIGKVKIVAFTSNQNVNKKIPLPKPIVKTIKKI